MEKEWGWDRVLELEVEKLTAEKEKTKWASRPAVTGASACWRCCTPAGTFWFAS